MFLRVRISRRGVSIRNINGLAFVLRIFVLRDQRCVQIQFFKDDEFIAGEP